MRKDHRRKFLLASSALLAAPLGSLAQPAQMVRRIGFLSLDTASGWVGQEAQQQFPEALSKLGFKEGGNLAIEWRWADGKNENLPGLAEGLVRAKVEVIVARTNYPISAAIKATKSIPIVMLNGGFPVEHEYVQSLAHPGGNVTGTSWMPASMHGKQIQILKELAPSTVRVAVPVSAPRGSAYEKAMKNSMQQAASTLGIALQYFYITSPEQIPKMLSEIAASGSNAFWYSGDPFMRPRGAEVMTFLREKRMAHIGSIMKFADSGGLAHYAPDISNFYERAASFVARILNGARPSDLPVEEPTKFEFAINLSMAKALGLVISPSVLARADKVIE